MDAVRAGAAAAAVLAGSYGIDKAVKAHQRKKRGSQYASRNVTKTGRTKRRQKRPTGSRQSGASLKNQVTQLKRIAEADMGTHIERERTTGRVLAAVNAQDIKGFNAMSTSTIERALAKLEYYNISAPATLVVASGLTGTYMKDFYISRTYSKFTARNNYQVPCKIKVFVVRPRVDTAINALTAFTNGLTDSGNPLVTSPLVQLTDSQQFNELWRIEKSKSYELAPGEECVMSFAFKPFQYDPSLVDSQTGPYLRKYGACTFMVRLEGVLGHDSVETSEQTTLQAGVDTMYETMVECKYAAGVDLYNVSVVNNADTTFTNAGRISAKPVVDNQSYSLA